MGCITFGTGLCQSCSSTPLTIQGLRVEFVGRAAFSESALCEVIRKELDRYRDTPSPTILSDAAFRITHQYELAGYSGTRVEFAVLPDKILFTIIESPFVGLGEVHVFGMHALSEEELLKGLPEGLLGPVPFSDPLVAEIESHISSIYADRGYAEASVDVQDRRLDETTHRMNLLIRVTEGVQYTVAGFRGLPEVSRIRVKVSGVVGKPFTPATAGEIEGAILDDYRQHGYPFVRVGVHPNLDRSTGTVQLEVEIVPGPEARLGKLEIQGNSRTRSSFIQSRSDLEEGKLYDDADLRNAEKRLLSTALFNTVQLAPGPLQEETGRVPVELKVAERDAGEVSLSLGYGTLDGIRGGAEFRYNNLLGGAEMFRASATDSRYGYRGESELSSPFILGTDFRPGLTAFYEEEEYPSFNALTYGGDLSLSYPLLEKLRLTMGIRHSIVHTKDVAPGVPPGDLLDFTYSAPFMTLLLDLRDNPLLPTRGFLLDTRLEWSDRIFGSQIQYLSANGRAVYLFPLPWTLDLVVSFQGGIIAPIEDTQSIPIALRYFAGGISTVRGFKFASLGPQVNGEATGGEVLLALQAEVRYPIWGDLHGALFSDRGDVWTDYREVNLGDVRYSVGNGLRYYTPAGAIVADFAWNPDRNPGERGWEFHFCIGFPF